MTTLAAAILAGTCSPWRSHVIMHPCNHDILNYTEKTKICPACTVLYVRKAVENKNDPLTLCTQGSYYKYNTY